jgi:hypothetical protein
MTGLPSVHILDTVQRHRSKVDTTANRYPGARVGLGLLP